MEIPSNIQFTTVKEEMGGAKIAFLDGKALLQTDKNWDGNLYRPIDTKDSLEEFEIRLVSYFTWENRGKSEMSVWIPLKK